MLRRYHFNKVKTLSDAQQAKYVEYAKLLARCELYRISWSLQKAASSRQRWLQLLAEVIKAYDVWKVFSGILGCRTNATGSEVARRMVETAESLDKLTWKAQVSLEVSQRACPLVHRH